MTAETVAQHAAVKASRGGQGKSEAAVESIPAVPINEAASQQIVPAIAEPLQIAAQTGARRIANAQALNQGAIVNPSCAQIRPGWRGNAHLRLMESVDVFE